MKILYWNIFKLGSSKLNNKMNATAVANGLGNNLKDYVVKVATGDAVWAGATSTTPVDALLIIELVSGGDKKDSAGSGACIRVLKALKAAMNTVVSTNAAYVYDYVPPKVIGYRETVGVIYNTVSLTYSSAAAMRNTANTFLLPRTAMWARFNRVGTNPVRPLNLIGIHGPTSTPPTDYREAVAFTNALNNVAQINQSAINPKEDTCLGGDFNCDPKNYYKVGSQSKQRQIFGFADLKPPYAITLANGTKTSLLQSFNASGVGGDKYLSQPYDNILTVLPTLVNAPPVLVVDLVGNAPTYGTSPAATFNAARIVSDHLPMSVSF